MDENCDRLSNITNSYLKTDSDVSLARLISYRMLMTPHLRYTIMSNQIPQFSRDPLECPELVLSLLYILTKETFSFKRHRVIPFIVRRMHAFLCVFVYSFRSYLVSSPVGKVSILIIYR